jgi:16S rRNA (cytosine1402-N4)-methyltransferase
MLRSLVNKELESVSSIPQIAPLNLNPEGRLAVISFHSLEDKIIKDAFRNLAQDIHGDKIFRVVTKKPVIATEEESRTNPRSRSAKLRILERAS